VVQTDLTVEQGIESLVSGGILFPDRVALNQESPPPAVGTS
jgi:uncharacterized membrane protein